MATLTSARRVAQIQKVSGTSVGVTGVLATVPPNLQEKNGGVEKQENESVGNSIPFLIFGTLQLTGNETDGHVTENTAKVLISRGQNPHARGWFYHLQMSGVSVSSAVSQAMMEWTDQQQDRFSLGKKETGCIDYIVVTGRDVTLPKLLDLHVRPLKRTSVSLKEMLGGIGGTGLRICSFVLGLHGTVTCPRRGLKNKVFYIPVHIDKWDDDLIPYLVVEHRATGWLVCLETFDRRHQFKLDDSFMFMMPRI